MSLINKMLQDLDARRSDASGSDTYGGQIRAVPERRGIHAAWWVALALAIALLGVLTWMALRPEAASQEGARAQLPLKLDTDLKAVQTAPQQHAPQAAITAPAVSLPLQVDTSRAPVTVAEPVAAQISAPLDPAPAPGDKPAAEPPSPQLSTPKPAAVAVQSAAPAKPGRVRDTGTNPARAASDRLPSADAVQAITANKQVKELTPQQRAENEYRKAVNLVQQGRSAEAMASLEQALELDARHAAARQTLIGLLLDSGRREDAMRRAREGLSLDAGQLGLAMILARLQLEKDELRPAIETLERSLPHAAGRADYAAFLAALLQRDGRHKEAAQQYLLALNKAPQNGLWWMGLGISLQADNRPAEAQEAYGRAKSSGSLSPELLAFVESRLKQLQR